jgi:hypothetical protein
MPAPTSQTGAAGEFYVAAQLSQRGWAASILLGNAPRTDILAQHAETGTTIGVQSKAANGGGDFQVGVKGEIPSKPGQSEWFIFVGLGSPDTRPKFFIVPRNVIAAFAWCSHQAWIKGTSRDGKPHKDNSMRNISQSDLADYEERWDDLLLPPDEIPYWLPDWLWYWVDEVGLPEGHPGTSRPVSSSRSWA